MPFLGVIAKEACHDVSKLADLYSGRRYIHSQSQTRRSLRPQAPGARAPAKSLHLGRPAKREVFLYAFDLLELDGRDMRREPWSDRRWRLARLLRGAGHGVQLSDHMHGSDGEASLRHACAMGLEGIVAKRRDKPYRSGRSPDWIKIKNPDAPAATRLIEG